MTVRVGINGFGRIGRNLFRILHARNDIRIRAISDLAEPEGLAYLLKFDTLLGRFPEELSVENGSLIVGSRRIPRLKVEYQLSRAIFFRAVGEYDALNIIATDPAGFAAAMRPTATRPP